MTFRDVYKNELDLIRPDEAVINSILLKMRKEAVNPAPLFRRISVVQFAAAAAGVCILIAAAVVIPALSRDTLPLPSADAYENRDNSAITAGDGMFYVESEYDGGAGGIIGTEDDFGSNRISPAPEVAYPQGGGDYEDDVATIDDAGESDDFMPASEPETGDISPFDIAPEPLEFHEEFQEFLIYNSFREWPDESLWNNLEVKIPERNTHTFPNSVIEDVAWDNGDADDDDYFEDYSQFVKVNTLREFTELVFNEEHTLLSANYRFESGYESNTWLTFQGIDASPVYSMLSKYLDEESSVLDWTGTAWYDPAILFNFVNEKYNIFIHIAPTDELIAVAAGLTDRIIIKLEPGEYYRLLGFLESL
ncbi:MAG: hypothetical protein LBC82_09570 [Oscillospiraceae bacterium]|jgi:hypothetical protein|nr:hypothetical protein [Oscillospiraceae bacterium]